MIKVEAVDSIILTEEGMEIVQKLSSVLSKEECKIILCKHIDFSRDEIIKIWKEAVKINEENFICNVGLFNVLKEYNPVHEIIMNRKNNET